MQVPFTDVREAIIALFHPGEFPWFDHAETVMFTVTIAGVPITTRLEQQEDAVSRTVAVDQKVGVPPFEEEWGQSSSIGASESNHDNYVHYAFGQTSSGFRVADVDRTLTAYIGGDDARRFRVGPSGSVNPETVPDDINTSAFHSGIESPQSTTSLQTSDEYPTIPTSIDYGGVEIYAYPLGKYGTRVLSTKSPEEMFAQDSPLLTGFDDASWSEYILTNSSTPQSLVEARYFDRSLTNHLSENMEADLFYVNGETVDGDPLPESGQTRLVNDAGEA